jgi:hypothetical protein
MTMLRRTLALAAAAAVLSTQAVDLHACGDKFLRAGRSSRMKGYAAMYPAAILLRPSPAAKPAVVSAWQKMLKDAGHKAQVAPSGVDLATTVAAGAYDLVITDFGSAAQVRMEIMAARSKPGVLPVLSESTKALSARATAEFEHFIDPEMSNREKLAEIDHIMEARLKTVSANAHP